MVEVLVVFILFVLAPLSVFLGIRLLRGSGPGEKGRRATTEGSGMRRSELESMIRDAVIEETAKLEARVDELEQEVLLGDGRLDASALAEAFDDDLAPEAKAARSGSRDHA